MQWIFKIFCLCSLRGPIILQLTVYNHHDDVSWYFPTDRTVCAGSRNAILNTEARTVEAEVLSRRCVMMRLADFSYEKYQKALRQSAGAVVIIIPKNMSTMPQDIVQVRAQNRLLIICVQRLNT